MAYGRSVAVASVVLVAFSALHCGGEVSSSDAGGGGGAGGAGGSSGSAPGSCPVSHGLGPVQVEIGGSCDWGGASCYVAVPAGCGPGSTEDTTCVCTDGKIRCPSFIPPPCVEACPVPSSVVAGEACAGDITCMSTIPEYDCAGNITGHAFCSCASNQKWGCQVTVPLCPPTCDGGCDAGAAPG
jgi:hypothetical protein